MGPNLSSVTYTLYFFNSKVLIVLFKIYVKSSLNDYPMENLIDAHYFSLPTQGNVYSFVNLCLTNGSNKSLIASLKRKVYSCEFQDAPDGKLIPAIKEVPFTYIPSGAEIISIDAFNRAETYDDFLIGITIIKTNGDQNMESYLNIYLEQEVEEGAELNLESIAQNCLMLELSYVPYQLYHTDLFVDESREVVWLLSGSDTKVHLFREDPQNHAYNETDIDELFPEFSSLPSIAVWFEIRHCYNNKRRLSAIGTECGFVKFCVIDTSTSLIILNVNEQFDAPIASVGLFSLNSPTPSPPECLRLEKDINPITEDEFSYNLVVINTLQTSIVYMDIINNGMSNHHFLPDSDKYDTSLTVCVADINMDGKMELLLGTYSQSLLMYKFENGTWCLGGQRKFADPIHSIDYRDITGDGLSEILVLTLTGIHILQHDPLEILKLFKGRLSAISFRSFCQIKKGEDASNEA